MSAPENRADIDPAVVALIEQQAELSDVLAGLGDTDWELPSRCDGWSVRDVVLHLAQTNELAIGSLDGSFAAVAGRFGGGGRQDSTIDDAVADMVDRERGASSSAIHERWESGVAALQRAFESCDLSRRVPWATGELSARTLATTRLAETWIHTGDVADAVGVVLLPSDRLRDIARLAWRTLPYAFARAGQKMTGPVAFELDGPRGDRWDFVPDAEPLTTIRGSADDLCNVAARRIDPSDTSLVGDGPDAAAVLDLVRTYA